MGTRVLAKKSQKKRGGKSVFFLRLYRFTGGRRLPEKGNKTLLTFPARENCVSFMNFSSEISLTYNKHVCKLGGG